MNDALSRISPQLRLVGSAPTPPGWVEPMRWIYDHELVLFAAGDYRLDLIGTQLPCPAGSFIIVPPGMRHTTLALNNRPGLRGWIHFDWEYRERHDDDPIFTYLPAPCRTDRLRPAPAYLPPGVRHGRAAAPAEAWEYFTRIAALFHRGSAVDQLQARGVLLELLVRLLGCDASETPTPAPDGRASLLRRALEQYAHLPCREAPGIQEFLKNMGQSYAHSCRIFRRQYGIAPLAYVHELRMTRARLLLRDTRLSVAETAEALGFNQPGYFARLFRQSAGISPREYRRRDIAGKAD